MVEQASPGFVLREPEMPTITNPEENSGLTPDQKQASHRVERMLMAPCCYTQTIDLHNSDIASTMRQEVVQMIVAGKQAPEIFAHYKAIYGEQILAVPDGRLGQAAYAIPAAVATAATGVLCLILWKFHQRKTLVLKANHVGSLSIEAQSLRASIRRETEW